MGYELYLHGAPGESLRQGDFEFHFAERRFYARDDEVTFAYSNHFTGVDFRFEIIALEGRLGPVVCFAMNVFRPGFFALEAELEVAAFLAHFGFDIDDPQTEGMRAGPYTREGFLKSWNGSNEVSHGLVIGSGLPVPVRTQPTAVSEHI